MTTCSVMATDCKKVAGHYYLDFQLVTPDSALREGQILQIPVGTTRGKSPFNLRRLLNICFNNPRTLVDLGLQTTPGVSTITMVATLMQHQALEQAKNAMAPSLRQTDWTTLPCLNLTPSTTEAL